MRKMTLGRTKFDVTQLGYGALEVRGTTGDDGRGRMPNEERADRVLNAVLDSGINFIDTGLQRKVREYTDPLLTLESTATGSVEITTGWPVSL